MTTGSTPARSNAARSSVDRGHGATRPALPVGRIAALRVPRPYAPYSARPAGAAHPRRRLGRGFQVGS